MHRVALSRKPAQPATIPYSLPASSCCSSVLLTRRGREEGRRGRQKEERKREERKREREREMSLELMQQLCLVSYLPLHTWSQLCSGAAAAPLFPSLLCPSLPSLAHCCAISRERKGRCVLWTIRGHSCTAAIQRDSKGREETVDRGTRIGTERQGGRDRERGKKREREREEAIAVLNGDRSPESAGARDTGEREVEERTREGETGSGAAA